MTSMFPKEFRIHKEFRVFSTLSTPVRIQDFLDTFPINFERGGETNYSPLLALKRGRIHCFEGALLAAAILWYHGEKPLLLDLETTTDDISHVVALFQHRGRWGAIAKSNHAVLRYRDPVFLTVRELVMSYFNEYFKNSTGKKTLRSYAGPFDLRKLDPGWVVSKEHTWNVVNALNASRHIKILSPHAVRFLRRADVIERKAGRLVEYKHN